MLGLCCSVRTSLVEVSGGYSLVTMCRLLIVVASRAVGHRLWGTWASGVMARGLRSVGLLVVVHGLSCLRHWGSSQTSDGTGTPCIARQIPNHWTAREARLCFLKCFRKRTLKFP